VREEHVCSYTRRLLSEIMTKKSLSVLKSRLRQKSLMKQQFIFHTRFPRCVYMHK